MKLCKKFIFLYLFGGIVYYILEVLWRGYTHWSMGVLGGICFIFVGLLNEIYTWDMALVSQMVVSSLIITISEFICGVIVNLWLGLDVWDYSLLPYNFMGQICLFYSNLWFVLSLPGILLDDYLRYLYFNEEKPKYKIL